MKQFQRGRRPVFGVGNATIDREGTQLLETVGQSSSPKRGPARPPTAAGVLRFRNPRQSGISSNSCAEPLKQEAPASPAAEGSSQQLSPLSGQEELSRALFDEGQFA